MSIVAALNHVTHYRYDRAITLGMQTIRLRPAPHARSHIRAYSLKVSPSGHFLNWQQDPFGNYLAQVVFPKKVKELRVEVDLVTEIRVFNPFDFFLEDYAKDFPFRYEPLLEEELGPYLEIKESGPRLESWLETIDRTPRGVIDFLVSVNQEVNRSLTYLIRMEPGVLACEETLAARKGSCRDMAWLLCQALRHLGFATRFASGYLIQLKPDVTPLGGPAGPESDFTDLHAWAEVYLPGAGWVGLDATSGLFAGEGHIPLCCTPTPSSAAPISGTHEPGEVTFEFHMDVTRIEEEARVTRPFTKGQWKSIDALGRKVDAQLDKQDVRLTMGGEPTFISEEDRIGEEWHFTALSKSKAKLGYGLFLRLRDRFASGGLLQITQGKWYPGEELPRWAMQCSWRRDGEPVWREDALLADPHRPVVKDGKMPQAFLARLAGLLGIPEDYVLPAYAPADKTGQGKRPAGYALPLHFSATRKNWISNRWRFKSGAFVLIAGDSPLGLRLPLSELPEVKDAQKEWLAPHPAASQVKPLPKHAQLSSPLKSRPETFAKDANGLIRTAVCAETRAGVLYIFLPPVARIEHFLSLVALVERTARELSCPVALEGYPPPFDRRADSFSVTPDPGVLEVNIQPAANWQGLKDIVGGVYEEARESRLTAEKFLIDGRAVGTGGGNHIVLGAAVVEDSPFLRRPDLLSSLICFWQNHPSLSYLFSSMYIGPTSQSPRVDEARHDALYELEIAFREIEQAKGKLKPEMVDGLLRNLLVDVSGNTHRVEFCIDKLYASGPRGRLGLLEMRGFEMTPHPQMNLLQALLVRACIACFWKMPYKAGLIRWGTRLHDQYLLPYYLKEDLREVLDVLKEGGFAFPPEWFEPFFAFRFPHYGSVKAGPLTLSLRMALEPWLVLGEEAQAGGVSRTVDSSIERLEVTVEGALTDRHAVTCNGLRLPLKPTSRQDSSVAGVRYKAWALPLSLHPLLPVNTPLVFDVVDTELGRSLGGCTYHVMHPGGRNYEIYPVNANEAEGRRLSRFEPMGHRPGRLEVPPLEPDPDFPHTLDLRRS